MIKLMNNSLKIHAWSKDLVQIQLNIRLARKVTSTTNYCHGATSDDHRQGATIAASHTSTTQPPYPNFKQNLNFANWTFNWQMNQI